ncbi:HAD family hydrolase [Halomonas salipaludis]|uniref:HAD family phosphatase n=1 Tax=Halomonas salipaludis TaxID=2032625 RepID=A0A2A2EVT5_9GAMM|nr:HAD family phosphatase [Halomonas salipaludis]PAU76467.1 hypothetical protein CK498_10660 [Halomonas salipaludis]
MASLRGILFDHDGTLVDSEMTHFEMWETILGEYGVQLTQACYQLHYAGIPTSANASDMVARFAMPVSAGQLVAAKEALNRDFLAQRAFPLRAGAYDAVTGSRAAGLQTAIVTGAGRAGVDMTLKSYALSDHIDDVVSGDDVLLSKPAPDCYQLALQRLGLPAEQCVAVEDTEHGVAAATAAGITCLAVPTAMSTHHDFSRAVGIFETLDAAIEWVMSEYRLCRP